VTEPSAAGATPGAGAVAPRNAILAIAVLQGFALYGLHRAVAEQAWPATDLQWLVPLYLLAGLVPLTAQLLDGHLHKLRLWAILAGLGAGLAYAGWHFGARVLQSPAAGRGADAGLTAYFSHLLPLLLAWLIAMAFLRAWLEADRGSPPYPRLFSAAWRGKITLLEACVFTGAFWILLALWAELFHTLEIDFFRELFTMPLFAYPVTAIVFGFALHLIGSVDRLVDVVLAQILGLLKWLAPLAGLIVVLFTLALLPKLPALLASSERPVSATWLLWLVACNVLLLNAAYQDGKDAAPYGRWLSAALRCVPPMLLVIAGVALYSISVRVASLGLTNGRFWGLFVALAALAYALAYSVAALRTGPWLGLMGRANTVIGVAIAGGLLLTLTPAASPFRLSAASQQQRVLDSTDAKQAGPALAYLHDGLAGYGKRSLEQLARLQDHPESARIRSAAAAALAGQSADMEGAAGFERWLSALRVHPAGTSLPPALVDVLRARHEAPDSAEPSLVRRPLGLWLDMTGEAGSEFLLVSESGAVYRLLALREGRWQVVSEGILRSEQRPASAIDGAALMRGDFSTQPPLLPGLRIGKDGYTLQPDPP
jgi:hypothetical protein